MKETDRITEYAINKLRQNGFVAWRNNNAPVYDSVKKIYRRFHPLSLKGIHDILAICPCGKILGVEIKSSTDRLSKSQKAVHEIFRQYNAYSFTLKEGNESIVDVFIENYYAIHPELANFRELNLINQYEC